MNAAIAVRPLALLRPATVFHPRQRPVAEKNLATTDTMMVTHREMKQIPSTLMLRELIQAGQEHVADVVTLAELMRQTQIAEKFADAYVLLRDLSAEWDRFAAIYPDAAADGWLGLLVNRARVLRAEIDGIADANGP
ncbi:hypothetical protein G3O00_01585 [Burkholderia sp. Ac-20384]|uniref:hypothetical protein n=1 Tax=Burkholderia sp. Ac-20384 TaxID=2703902 RepID=UPI0019803A38|nr:hypothetical protein [Burkholderia sp. Ac-20384]MBN3822310.1 hypothetical protein [Burkholderia sp. Ac-20384]